MINIKKIKYSIKQILIASLCMVSALTFGVGPGNLAQPLLAGAHDGLPVQPPAQVGMESEHTEPDMTIKDFIIQQLLAERSIGLGKPITQGNAQPICKIHGNIEFCYADTVEIGGQRRFLPCVSNRDRPNHLVDNLRQARDQKVEEVLKCVKLKRGDEVIDTPDLNSSARNLGINDIDITTEISPEINHLLEELAELDQVQTKTLRKFLGDNFAGARLLRSPHGCGPGSELGCWLHCLVMCYAGSLPLHESHQCCSYYTDCQFCLVIAGVPTSSVCDPCRNSWFSGDCLPQPTGS